jgi:MoxR-like ATPase
VLDVAPDVLRHRLVLSYDALADGVPAEHVVHRVLQSVPLPQVTPRQRAAGGPYGAQNGGYAGGGASVPAGEQEPRERSA